MPVTMILHTNATIQAVNATVQASSHHGSGVPALTGLVVGVLLVSSYFIFTSIANRIKKHKAKKQEALRMAEQEYFLEHLRNKRNKSYRQKHCRQSENMKRIFSK